MVIAANETINKNPNYGNSGFLDCAHTSKQGTVLPYYIMVHRMVPISVT